MGGSSSKASLSGSEIDEDAVNQAVADHVIEVHQEATRNNATRQALRHSLSKVRLEVRLKKRKSMKATGQSHGGTPVNFLAGSAFQAAANAVREVKLTPDTNIRSGRKAIQKEHASFHLGAEEGPSDDSGKKIKRKKSKKEKKDKQDKKKKKKKKKKSKKSKKDRMDAGEDSEDGDLDTQVGSGGTNNDGSKAATPSPKKKKKKDSKKYKKDKSGSKKKKRWPRGILQKGVTIRFLQQVLGRVKVDMSAEDVCREIVRLDTKDEKIAYTELLTNEGRCDFHGNSLVGKGTHFVSYVRDEPFVELVSALDVFVNLHGLNPGRVFFWLDIFSLNQHTAFIAITQDWLTNSLPAAISRLRGFVLVTPPQAPLALKRMWCVWELFSAIEHDCEIFVHTSGKLHAAFQKQIMERKALKSLIAAFSKAVASEGTSASDPSHSAMLKACLHRAGFQYVDYQVSSMLRKWLARSGQALVERLLKTAGTGGDKEDKKTALDISVLVGGLWKDLGELEAAEPMYRCVLRLREDILGKDSARTIKALQNLGSLLQALHSKRMNMDADVARLDGGSTAQDFLSEAELLFRRALVKQEQIRGLTDPLTLQSINNFAVFCQKHMKLREAELLYRRAYKGFEEAHGKMHEHTLQAGHNLASLLQEEGETTEAAALYQEVFEGRVAVLGGEDPRTLQTQSKLGTLYQATGDVVEAENIFRQLITMYTDTDGARSAEVIDAKAMLATCLVDSKRFEEAEVLLTEVFDERRGLLGESDPLTLSAGSELASLNFSQKRFDDAKNMYRRILELRSQSLGKRHLSTLASMTKVASVCYAKNELDEAEAMYRHALSGYRRTLGMSNSLTMGCVDMLARLLKQQGKFEDALQFYEMARANFCETLGPESPDALNMIGSCGMCLRAMGNERKGNAMLRDAISRLRVVLKKEPVNSPILKSLKRRITRFERCLATEETNLKATLKRTLSASFDQLTGGLRRKSGSKNKGQRQNAWTKSTASSSSNSLLEMKSDEPTEEERHFKPAGIAVAATHRLLSFTRPRAVQPMPLNKPAAATAKSSGSGGKVIEAPLRKVGSSKQKDSSGGGVGVNQKRKKPLVMRGARGPRMRPRGIQPRPPKGAPPPVKITPKTVVRVEATSSPRLMLRPRPAVPTSSLKNKHGEV